MTALSFAEVGQHNPCAGCPAPCCRMQLVPYKVPRTAFDIDHVRYMLLFPSTELIVGPAGDWFVLKWEDCRKLDAEACLCTVHGTPEQPRICVTYNAFDCWYRRNFVTDSPPELYRLNLERFERWVQGLLFDEQGAIVEAPCFEEAQALVKAIPITPSFRAAGELLLEGDIRVAQPQRPAAERRRATSPTARPEREPLAAGLHTEA